MASSSHFAQDSHSWLCKPASKASTKEDQLAACHSGGAKPEVLHPDEPLHPKQIWTVGRLTEKASVHFPAPPRLTFWRLKGSHRCPRAPWEMGATSQGWQWLVQSLEAGWRTRLSPWLRAHLYCFSSWVALTSPGWEGAVSRLTDVERFQGDRLWKLPRPQSPWPSPSLGGCSCGQAGAGFLSSWRAKAHGRTKTPPVRSGWGYTASKPGSATPGRVTLGPSVCLSWPRCPWILQGSWEDL